MTVSGWISSCIGVLHGRFSSVAHRGPIGPRPAGRCPPQRLKVARRWMARKTLYNRVAGEAGVFARLFSWPPATRAASS